MKTSWAKKVMRILTTTVLLTVICSVFITAPVHAVTRDLYWVGGSGNTNDVNHWDLHPLDAGGDAVPDSDDNVFFGASSFTPGSATVTVNAALDCLNMDWTGATNTPVFTCSGFQTIRIYGSLTFISAMSATLDGSIVFFGNGVQTITTNGLDLSGGNGCEVKFYGGTGTYTLQDALKMATNKQLYCGNAGITNTNGKTVTCGAFVGVTDSGAPTITLGNSIINCASVSMSATPTFAANTSTINCSGNFDGGDLNFNGATVNLTGATSTITGSNTVASWNCTRGGALTQSITFTDTTTQTAASFDRTGTGQITFQGSAAAGWALTDSNGGTNTVNALTVSRCTAIGAVYSATTTSLNSGNNVGWTFPATFTTESISGTTYNSSTANATIVDQAGAVITARGFCYNTTGTPTTANNTVVVAGTLGAYSGTIPNGDDTVHFVRPYFTNGLGTFYGAERSYNIPSNTGEALLKSILRVGLAAGILITVVRGIGKNNWAIGVIIGTIAFAIVDTFINMI